MVRRPVNGRFLGTIAPEPARRAFFGVQWVDVSAQLAGPYRRRVDASSACPGAAS